MPGTPNTKLVRESMRATLETPRWRGGGVVRHDGEWHLVTPGTPDTLWRRGYMEGNPMDP